LFSWLNLFFSSSIFFLRCCPGAFFSCCSVTPIILFKGFFDSPLTTSNGDDDPDAVDTAVSYISSNLLLLIALFNGCILRTFLVNLPKKEV
jgi:hypothetical protein